MKEGNVKEIVDNLISKHMKFCFRLFKPLDEQNSVVIGFFLPLNFWSRLVIYDKHAYFPSVRLRSKWPQKNE